jgi:hypothetical protein
MTSEEMEFELLSCSRKGYKFTLLKICGDKMKTLPLAGAEESLLHTSESGLSCCRINPLKYGVEMRSDRHDGRKTQQDDNTRNAAGWIYR